MIRLADARFSASTRIRLSISHSLIGVVCDWITKASVPRTESFGRMNSSPFANTRRVVGVTVTPISCAISSASCGYAPPESSTRLFRPATCNVDIR